MVRSTGTDVSLNLLKNKMKKETGIIVFGYNRYNCLRNTLTSLVKQNTTNVHVWLDLPAVEAIQDKDKSNKCISLVRDNFTDYELYIMESHTGIEFMTLYGLEYICNKYKKIIVLEDDCFPVKDAIRIFNTDLDQVEKNPEIFSIYGHHYLVWAERNGRPIGRFNGWGWGTHAEKLEKILPDMKSVLSMKEDKYFDFVNKEMTWKIRRRLDVTSKRSAVRSIQKVKSWDGVMCLLTAMRNLKHKRTSRRVIYNCGGNSSASLNYKSVLRNPPYNMIDENEVWEYFEK